MIEHLTAEQISQWMIGERGMQLEQHVAACAECRTELEQLESALVHFRGAVKEFGGTAVPSVWQPVERRASWFSWPRMVAAAAALMVLVAGPYIGQARERARAAAAADAARADAQLMERVDSSLSRSVPAPMEPLLTLVSWNSNREEKKTRTKTP